MSKDDAIKDNGNGDGGPVPSSFVYYNEMNFDGIPSLAYRIVSNRLLDLYRANELEREDPFTIERGYSQTLFITLTHSLGHILKFKWEEDFFNFLDER